MKLLRSAFWLNMKPLLLDLQLVRLQAKAKILVVITSSMALLCMVWLITILQAPADLAVVHLLVVVMVAVVIDCYTNSFP